MSQERESIVYLKWDKELQLQSIKKEYDITVVGDIKELLMALINGPEASVVVFNRRNEEFDKKLLGLLGELNGVLPLIGVGDHSPILEEYVVINREFLNVETESELTSQFVPSGKARRRFHRTEWPLLVKFFLERKPDDFEEGEVLSFSAGGAFVKASNLRLVGDEKLLLEVKFRDFTFMVDGRVVYKYEDNTTERPMGFAVEFENVTEATHTYVLRLVNDRILNEILEEFDLKL